MKPGEPSPEHQPQLRRAAVPGNAEVDRPQLAILGQKRDCDLKGALPIGDHRQGVGDENPLEFSGPENICCGSKAVASPQASAIRAA